MGGKISMYPKIVEDLYNNPMHFGSIENAIRVCVMGADSNSKVELFLAQKNGIIEDFKYLALGCPFLIAACEYVSANVIGQKIEILNINYQELISELSMPKLKSHVAIQLEQALQELLTESS